MAFKAKYEFDVSAEQSHREPRIVICCEGMPHNDGEGSLRFSLETRHPETFDFDTQQGVPAHVVEHGSATVYSYALVTPERDEHGSRVFSEDDAAWHLREMVVALARGDIGGKSVGHIIYHVFWHTVAKKKPGWLIENAAEWWELVDPSRREER